MLGVLLPLAIFGTFCDASCIFRPLEFIPGIEQEGCRDGNGAMLEFGTESESNCVRCSCQKGFGLNCCSTVLRPKGYDKTNCKEIFNKETCTIYPVQKNNPTIACKVAHYIG